MIAAAPAAAIILGHAIIAQHRIYDESWPKKALKAVAVAVAVAVAALYAVLWGLASTGAAVYVTLARA